jgi:hypothetical protein
LGQNEDSLSGFVEQVRERRLEFDSMRKIVKQNESNENNSSQDMTKAIQQYSKAIEAGVEVRRHELAIQQEHVKH